MADSPTRPSSSSPASSEGPSSQTRRARQVAEALLEVDAVALRPGDPFTWSSGLVAPIYCDNRRTMAFPAVRRLIRDGLAALVDDHDLLPATIAGTATAGIPHAAWLAAATDQPMAYVRSAAKSHGTKARIEGALGAGESAVVVEDLISTGGSALDAVAALREAGVTVRAVLAIFSYQLDAADAAFRDAGVDRHVLTDFRTLVDVAHDAGRLSDADLEALSDWRADPEAWSAAHGGTRPA